MWELDAWTGELVVACAWLWLCAVSVVFACVHGSLLVSMHVHCPHMHACRLMMLIMLQGYACHHMRNFIYKGGCRCNP